VLRRFLPVTRGLDPRIQIPDESDLMDCRIIPDRIEDGRPAMMNV
jgi:hypothetical protein